MKSITVKMTNAQAARIEKAADALRMEPGDLVKIFSLAELDGWQTACEFLDGWEFLRNAYATKASTEAGDRIEDELARMFGGKQKGRTASTVSNAAGRRKRAA